jgi:hypothetical protein
MKPFLLVLLVLLAGCSSMARIEPGTVTIKEVLILTTNGTWNRFESSSEEEAAEVWTADGLTLDVIKFYVGVGEGETLGFRATMSPHEIVELYVALVTQDGSACTLERLAPADFGGTQGFLFEHTTATRHGPVLAGLAYGAVLDGKLYLMSYTAPKSYFYARHLAQVRSLAASARIKSP